MLPNIHLLGIQGSGKGTQSSLLVERYGATYLASGNLFRKRAAEGDEFGIAIGKQLQAGRLLPDDYLVQTVCDFLATNPPAEMLLCDGVIRTLRQREMLADHWLEHNLDFPLLVYLDLDQETAERRVAERASHRDDPALRPFHEVYSGKLVQRQDDNPKALAERFKLFYELTEPIVQAFQAEGRCVQVAADQPIEAVQSQIRCAIESAYPDLA